MLAVVLYLKGKKSLGDFMVHS